jgi:hypothetical protein
MSKNKALGIVFSVLDYAFTFGGPAAVIVYNYVDKANSSSFKISITGMILVIALIYTAKYIFEKSYRQKYDTMLQQLAEATNEDVKAEISKKIDAYKIRNYIYQRIGYIIPFAVLYAVTFLGQIALESLNGTVGLILASLVSGTVFNVSKKPYWDKAKMETYQNKAAK